MYHNVHEVHFFPVDVAGLHRASRYENRGYVQAHGCEEHSGSHLVAIGYAHEGVGAVGVHHIFHGVGDKVARGERVEHPVVSHGYAVVHGYCVEFRGKAAKFFYFLLYELANGMKVGVSGHKLRERVGDGYHGLAHLRFGHAVGAPKSPGSGHAPAGLRNFAPEVIFHRKLYHFVAKL